MADAPAADEAAAEDVAAEAVSADDAAEAPAARPKPKLAGARAQPAPRVYEGPEPTTMEELLNEQPTEIRSLKHGDVVEGNVVRIDKDEILVDIGAKSEGVISNRELYGRNAESQPALNIGDQVLVYVLQPESPEGHAVLSLRRAGLERKWRAMQEQLDAGVIIEAPVIDHNKGGLIVDCGIRGFVPISQIVDFPRRPQNEQPRDAAQEIAEKLQPYVGRKLRLKILEVNRKANRLIAGLAAPAPRGASTTTARSSPARSPRGIASAQRPSATPHRLCWHGPGEGPGRTAYLPPGSAWREILRSTLKYCLVNGPVV